MRPAISKVAVIGAGPAGLPTAKRLRDYGIEVVIFERSSVAGGAWYVSSPNPNSAFRGNDCVDVDVDLQDIPRAKTDKALVSLRAPGCALV